MVKILYFDSETVDCTADPHEVKYSSLRKACEDILKVCESDLVYGVEKVYLYVKGDEKQTLESDWYDIDMGKGDKSTWKKATGRYARKHKVEGLYFYEDAHIYVKVGVNPATGEEICERRPMPKERHLPPGLTGVKEAVRRLLQNPEKYSKLRIAVVWSAFMTHNCSDYITLDVDELSVDYSNQDWYVDGEGYLEHIEKLSSLLAVQISPRVE
jgi:hypothetical protein